MKLAGSAGTEGRLRNGDLGRQEQGKPAAWPWDSGSAQSCWRCRCARARPSFSCIEAEEATLSGRRGSNSGVQRGDDGGGTIPIGDEVRESPALRRLGLATGAAAA